MTYLEMVFIIRFPFWQNTDYGLLGCQQNPTSCSEIVGIRTVHRSDRGRSGSSHTSPTLSGSLNASPSQKVPDQEKVLVLWITFCLLLLRNFSSSQSSFPLGEEAGQLHTNLGF